MLTSAGFHFRRVVLNFHLLLPTHIRVRFSLPLGVLLVCSDEVRVIRNNVIGILHPKRLAGGFACVCVCVCLCVRMPCFLTATTTTATTRDSNTKIQAQSDRQTQTQAREGHNPTQPNPTQPNTTQHNKYLPCTPRHRIRRHNNRRREQQHQKNKHSSISRRSNTKSPHCSQSMPPARNQNRMELSQ